MYIQYYYTREKNYYFKLNRYLFRKYAKSLKNGF